ncbi:hypothetical protein G97194_004742 [Escherichia coli]|uniref:hypothetical protein n=1 Tax=Escherichia coli TaxID=562 RepID=UPI000A3ADD1F|nr:hypothetical protein [Escherichia coli]OUF87364.1 hypothetical protein G97194_004742 [Escherichia coli]
MEKRAAQEPKQKTERRHKDTTALNNPTWKKMREKKKLKNSQHINKNEEEKHYRPAEKKNP